MRKTCKHHNAHYIHRTNKTLHTKYQIKTKESVIKIARKRLLTIHYILHIMILHIIHYTLYIRALKIECF